MTAFPVEREASEHFLLLQSILCRYKPEEEKYVAVPLTTDHSPSVYAERMRIQKAGGNVRLALLCYLVFTSYLLCYLAFTSYLLCYLAFTSYLLCYLAFTSYLLCYLAFTSYLLYIMPISPVPQTHACAFTADFFTTAS